MALCLVFRPLESVSINGTAFGIGKPPSTIAAALERDGGSILITGDIPVEVLPGVTVTLAGRIGPDTIPLAFEAPADCLIRRIPRRTTTGEAG